MYLKKKECPRLRIRWKKKEGNIQWVMGMFFLLLLAVLLCASLQTSIYRAASLYLEDALATSNLASAVIDIEEYGISHTVKIANPAEAYERYINAVKENLQLNEKWECANLALISGPVEIRRYIVYNVNKEEITIYEVSPGGGVGTAQGVLGAVKAPNGTLVTATSVYSEISFPVEGFLGVVVEARKGKLVDVVANENATKNKNE